MKRIFLPRGPKRPTSKPSTKRPSRSRAARRPLGVPGQIVAPAAPGISELVQHFLSNRAAMTLKAYRADLDAFAGFVGKNSAEQGAAELLSHGPAHANLLCIRWLGAMRDAKLAGSTRARRISTLRSLAMLARMLGVIDWEIEVRRPRFSRPLPRDIPNVPELRGILDACGHDLVGVRDRALFLLAVTMGLRRTELSSLKLRDYERKDGRLLVSGRAGRKTWMKVPPRTAMALDEWLCLSRGKFCSASENVEIYSEVPIFVRLDHGLSELEKAITPDGVYAVVKRIGEKAGIKLSPHILHNASLAAALETQHGNIRAVQRFGRYSDPSEVIRHDQHRLDDAGSIAESVALLTKGDGK